MAVTSYWHLFLSYLAHFLYLFLRTLARFLCRYVEVGTGGGKARALVLGARSIEMPLHQGSWVVILHQAFDVGSVHAVCQQVLLIFCRAIWRGTD